MAPRGSGRFPAPTEMVRVCRRRRRKLTRDLPHASCCAYPLPDGLAGAGPLPRSGRVRQWATKGRAGRSSDDGSWPFEPFQPRGPLAGRIGVAGEPPPGLTGTEKVRAVTQTRPPPCWRRHRTTWLCSRRSRSVPRSSSHTSTTVTWPGGCWHLSDGLARGSDAMPVLQFTGRMRICQGTGPSRTRQVACALPPVPR